MARTLFLTSALLLSLAAPSQAKTILDYSFGNKVRKSSLTVTDKGLVKITEFVCCSSDNTKIDTDTLASADLKILKEAIGQALKGRIIDRQCNNGSSPSYGSLVISDSRVSAIVFSRIRASRDNCVFRQNDSISSKTIEFFVDLYVDVTIPSS